MTDSIAQYEKPIPRPAADNNWIWAYAAVITTNWIAAGTFLVGKATTERFEPLALGWFRIVLSFLLIAVLFGLSRKKKRASASRGDLLRFACLGMMGVTLNQMFFLHGVHLAPAIDAALLYAFTPILVLVAARFLFQESLTVIKVAGVAIALAGVYLILQERGLALSSEYLKGDLVILVAVLAWTGYTLLGKSLVARFDALTVNFWAFGFGALCVLPLGIWILPGFDWSGPGWSGWLGLLYLSAMTSVVSFTLWTWALKNLEAGRVSIFTNLQPAITAFLAWIFLNEIPTSAVVIGGTLIITGVVLVQRRKKILISRRSSTV